MHAVKNDTQVYYYKYMSWKVDFGSRGFRSALSYDAYSHEILEKLVTYIDN